MSSNNDQMGGTTGSNEQPAASAEMLSIARRRAIFKGLSKGAALAGAAVPLASLATTGQRMRLKKDNNRFYQCTVSGNGSVALSQGTSVTQCGGRPTSDYACTDSTKVTDSAAVYWPKWPTKMMSGSRTVRAVCYGKNGTACSVTTKFNACFGWGNSTDTIGYLVHNRPTSDEAQWVTACLNATLYPNTFPYTALEVVAFSNSTDTTLKANALAFFRDWLNKPGLA